MRCIKMMCGVQYFPTFFYLMQPKNESTSLTVGWMLVKFEDNFMHISTGRPLGSGCYS